MASMLLLILATFLSVEAAYASEVTLLAHQGERSLSELANPPPPPPSPAASSNLSSNWSASPLYRAKTLVYYVHAVGNATGYTSRAPASPNWSTSYGLSAAFDYKVTADPSPDSDNRGAIRGFEIVDSLSSGPMSILVLNSIDYSDGFYVGSVSLHGAANVNVTDYDIAIAGGTGSFRGAAGVASITNLRTPGTDHVFRHILHFTHLHRVH